jgi:GNAT superfamily N-acetyltransferase
LNIKPLIDENLFEILSIDREAFSRVQPRSIVNLKGLWLSDPKGCFALWDENKLVGYSFCRTMGSEGYLGPVGIIPSYQKKGWGRKLILSSLEYLKSSCSVIGLEVRPEAGDSLGLYHKIGFRTGFPSFILQLPENIRGGQLFKIESFSELTETQQKTLLDKIDGWTREELQGVSYKLDLTLTYHGGGLVLVAKKDSKPLGFISSFKSVFPHLWGVVKPHRYQDEILMTLLSSFRDFHGPGEVLLEVNTRYQDLVDLLLKNNFKIQKSVNRMLLKGYEGEYLQESSSFIFRSWHV